MAQLAISRDFLSEYACLDRGLQVKVAQVVARFSEHTHAGIHLEKMAGARDSRVRTIRIDAHYRGIVMAPDHGDTFLVVRVLTHDESDKWVKRNRFSVNAATGALEVTDVTAVDDAIGALDLGPATSLFASRSDKDFTRLGLPGSLVPVLRRISDEHELDGLVSVLPPRQADALSGLAAGLSVEEIWAELTGAAEPGPIDADDFDAALDRAASTDRFRVVGGADELRDILDRPFDLWRVFLHPSQRRLADRRVYNGPVRVTGGAGTGKTVVAMHRAARLAGQDSGRILLTTYTRTLAAELERGMKTLAGPSVLGRVEVVNVDRVAWRIVADHEGSAPKVLTGQEELALCEAVLDDLGGDWPPSFLAQEWRQVVLAQGLSSRDEYLQAARPGRGVRLSRRQRVQVWRLIEEVGSRLVRRGSRSYVQLADAAAGYVAARTVRPYDHVVVDEAQDLHPAQWRMLRALVPVGPNDLFVVGDSHQRIYDSRVTLGRLGIKVTGRSYRLRLSYRTTQEILRWSLGLLGTERFDDLDAGDDTVAGYRSETRGEEPTSTGYPTTAEEMAALVGSAREWLADDVAPEEIAVIGRTNAICERAERALREAGIPARTLDASSEEVRGAGQPAVVVATMHRAKGLEFRCVAVVGADSDHLPLPQAVTPAAEDAVRHAQDIQRERCLLYVACSRAREQLRVSWSGRPSRLLEGE